ncbi:MAG: dinucleotide-binding enzyme [Alphaproteobacteria bacterium]|nr:MAG: dinucleotide-binding enzyme [Alphaproteobacteria bacterium]
MTIAIIGTGNVGSALARGWSRSGQRVVLGVRDVSAPKVTALAQETRADAKPPAEAAAAADEVVLALPWLVAEGAVKALGGLKDKIVIDCMNPLSMQDGKLGLDRGFTTSAAETLAQWIPQARIVKTLNQVGANLMADNAALPHRPVMFMAGNDAAAKATVSVLLTALGFEPLDAGDLTKARLLEPFAMLWINQALIQGKGRDWAFAAVGRRPSGSS